MAPSDYSELQLDGLRELMNTGAGHAAGDLGEMFDRGFDIDVPATRVMPLGSVIGSLGDPLRRLTAVSVRVTGGINGVLVVLLADDAAQSLCDALGLEWPNEMSMSMMQETANVLACAYAGAIGEMLDQTIEISPPSLICDTRDTTLGSVRASAHGEDAQTVLVESSMSIRDTPTHANVEILLLPDEGDIDRVMGRLGLH